MISDPTGRAKDDPDVAERAYLRRRAFQELGQMRATDHPENRIPHEAMAHAYCRRCRAIANPAECELCALRPLCGELAQPPK
jgi:hypothetical protein